MFDSINNLFFKDGYNTSIYLFYIASSSKPCSRPSTIYVKNLTSFSIILADK